jgi:hypothetical protein
VSTIDLGSFPSRLPVRTIIFLAATHRGLNIAPMQTLAKGRPTEKLIDELSERSHTLVDINQRFARIANDIKILSCYETKPTKMAIELSNT